MKLEEMASPKKLAESMGIAVEEVRELTARGMPAMKWAEGKWEDEDCTVWCPEPQFLYDPALCAQWVKATTSLKRFRAALFERLPPLLDDEKRATLPAGLLRPREPDDLSLNWQATRAAIADHLRGYLDGTLQHIDKEIVTALLVALAQTETGDVPDLFAPQARLRGVKRESAALQSCMESAGEYIVFCALHAKLQGIDPRPVATVTRTFAVSRSAASRWKEKVTDQRRSELAADASLFPMIRAAMRIASVHYVRFGAQSHEALKSRGSAR